MQIKPVENYLFGKSSAKSPFYLFTGDADYTSVKNMLHQKGLDIVPMSRFCNSDDKLPNIDELIDYILESDVNVSGKKFVVTGLGEFLALRGKTVAEESLMRLFRCNVGGSKVVLLLRGVVTLLACLKTDQRFDERCYSVLDNTDCSLSFTFASQNLNLTKIDSVRKLLVELENGRDGNIVVASKIDFDAPMFNVKKICNAYTGVNFYAENFTLPELCGTNEEWTKFLAEIVATNGDINGAFEKYGFDVMIGNGFRKHIIGDTYRSWLYFVFLKCRIESIQNTYLCHVLEITNERDRLVPNLLKAIIGIPISDARFNTFYNERKELVADFEEYEISDFILSNREEADCIYRLTDNTLEERMEVINWIAQNKSIPKNLGRVYPQLSEYLKEYIFRYSDNELANLLTQYFEQYKVQKITNELNPDFLERVNCFALERRYTGLPSRSEILDKVAKEDTKLYWFDALGVEYLAYIEELAKKMGLSISISIAQSELPSITEKNNDFYYSWPKSFRYEKNSDLDDTKHHKAGGYSFDDNKNPIHLARELDIIREAMGFAATELGKRKCTRFLIVSDHGASRLAVLRQKEEHYEVKYDTDTKPEASGRCCKVPEPYDLPLPFATAEDGYLVLADYGRFKGSRRANVEVHGGASLEEKMGISTKMS